MDLSCPLIAKLLYLGRSNTHNALPFMEAEVARVTADLPGTSLTKDPGSERGFEAPSGKGAGDENFPVGSFLIPRALRPHVATFYAFARAIDDIADNPALAPDDKLRRLEAFEAAILGETDAAGLEKARAMRESLTTTGITRKHCCDLISAFKQDAVKRRYADWAELMDYCNRSAAPVGRYLLDLHGEDPVDYPPSDALCNALQVINHLQDCADDFRLLDRVYLPEIWLAEAGVGVEALGGVAGGQDRGLRVVLDRCLTGVHDLLGAASALPVRLKNWHLALESGAIVALAERLSRRLGRENPVTGRVALAKPAFLAVAVKGAVNTWWRRI